METIAFVLLAVGFAGFGSAVIFELIQKNRTGGPVFEGRKKVVFPWIVISFLIFVVEIIFLELR